MNKIKILMVFLMIFGLSTSAEAFKLLTDKQSGGNPKLDKKTYKVYIQDDPTSNNRHEEVKEALQKWADELSGRGVDLSLQSGPPPETPLDLNTLNQDIKKFNEAADQSDLTKFPELKKLFDKNCTVSVYWKTSAEIGGGSERGKANNYWNFDDKGKADKIEASDVFLPTDPPGGSEDIKKRIIHNISMHEFGHVSGFDHYTPAQIAKGDVLEKDATLHSTKLDVSDEDKKGLDTVYGPVPTLKVDPKADNKQSSTLPQFIQDQLPTNLDHVWEYSYDLQWLEGSPVSYFQVQTDQSPVFFGFGSDGLDDWLLDLPTGDQNYLEFYSDSTYLGDNVFSGKVQFYSSFAPSEGFLVYSGGSSRGIAPIPEPSTLLLLAGGLLGAFSRRKSR